MEAFCAAHVFIRFCSQESHRGALQILLWASADLTHTSLTWRRVERRQLLVGGLFECITSSTVFMKISASLKTSLFHESRISAGPVHDAILQWDFSISAAVLNLQCPVLGEITFFVFPFFSPQKSKEITSYGSTFVQNILRQDFIWSVLAPFERCCRTWSWRASPSDDKKKWIIGLFIMLLKAKVHY